MSITQIIRQRLFSRYRSSFTSQNKRLQEYQIGEWTYGDPTVLSWGEGATLRVGKFCSLAQGVTIYLGGEHRIDWVTTYPFSALFPAAKEFTGHPRSKGDVVIGNDVWVGTDAVILSGVTVGDGAAIGARSVVTKDVAPYEIAAGNPARHVKFRFDGATVSDLLQIAWWDWPQPKIEEAWPLLLSPDVNAFVSKYKEA